MLIDRDQSKDNRLFYGFHGTVRWESYGAFAPQQFRAQ